MELLFILVFAVIILGPERLPEFARTMGRYWREFNKLREMIQREIAKETRPIKSTVDAIKEAPRSLEKSIRDWAKPLGSKDTQSKIGQSKEKFEDEIVNLARDLGIDVEGKEKDEIILEIRERIRGLKVDR